MGHCPCRHSGQGRPAEQPRARGRPPTSSRPACAPTRASCASTPHRLSPCAKATFYDFVYIDGVRGARRWPGQSCESDRRVVAARARRYRPRQHPPHHLGNVLAQRWAWMRGRREHPPRARRWPPTRATSSPSDCHSGPTRTPPAPPTNASALVQTSRPRARRPALTLKPLLLTLTLPAVGRRPGGPLGYPHGHCTPSPEDQPPPSTAGRRRVSRINLVSRMSVPNLPGGRLPPGGRPAAVGGRLDRDCPLRAWGDGAGKSGGGQRRV